MQELGLDETTQFLSLMCIGNICLVNYFIPNSHRQRSENWREIVLTNFGVRPFIEIHEKHESQRIKQTINRLLVQCITQLVTDLQEYFWGTRLLALHTKKNERSSNIGAKCTFTNSLLSGYGWRW